MNAAETKHPGGRPPKYKSRAERLAAKAQVMKRLRAKAKMDAARRSQAATALVNRLFTHETIFDRPAIDHARVLKNSQSHNLADKTNRGTESKSSTTTSATEEEMRRELTKLILSKQRTREQAIKTAKAAFGAEEN